MPEREYLTKKEAGDYLRLSRATLDRLVKNRELKAAKIGKKVVFSRHDLDALFKKHLLK